MPDELLKQTELARRLGVSRPAVRDWIQSGRLVAQQGKKYSLRQAEQLMQAGVGNRADTAAAGGNDPLRSMASRAARAAGTRRQPAPPENPELSPEWTQVATLNDPGDLALLRARARYASEAIGALRAAGKLVEARRVGDFLRLYIKECRERIRTMPDRWASRIAAETGANPAKVTKMLREMTKETMAEIENANLVDRFDQDITSDD